MGTGIKSDTLKRGEMLIETKLTMKMWHTVHTRCGKCIKGAFDTTRDMEEFQRWLVEQGWRYDTEINENICPECIKGKR